MTKSKFHMLKKTYIGRLYLFLKHSKKILDGNNTLN